MTPGLLPPWLPDWERAEEIAEALDPADLKATVSALLDLLLAEDTVLLDSLPTDLESAIIAPLDTLAEVYDRSDDFTELVVASRLVRRSAVPYLGDAPPEIKSLIESLPI